MADTKISALSAVTDVLAADEFAVNEAGTSKKATATQVSTFVKTDSMGLEVAIQMGMLLQ